jgi:FkbM family methyltransferase
MEIPPLQIPLPLRRRLEPLPFPTRFSDGTIRLTTARVALLRRVWAYIPVCAVESRHALNAYPGGDVLDVGAFHGWYSVLLAPKANPGDRLVSFEPDPHALPMLRKMLRDLGRQFPFVGLVIVTEPVGDGSAVAPHDPGAGTDHPRFSQSDEAGARPSLTIDDYVGEHRLRPTLIKIDTEGAELAVLRGARATLEEYRPAVMLEIHPAWQPDGIDAAEVEDLMHEVGYESTTYQDVSIARRQLWLPRVAVRLAS